MNALAYFSGTNLYDDRTGQWFYHAHKNVAHVELLLPQDAPAWAQQLKKDVSSDRAQGIRKLSELAEQAEKRKDARLYREFEFALPKELTDEQNIKLAREFLQDQVCGRGIAVVANLHFEEDEATGEARPHCHALMLTRRLEEKGLSAKKEIDWDRKDFLLTLREQLAPYTNFHLKLHGHDIRIDHRSYAERGIEIESQHIKTLHKRSGFHEQTQQELRQQYEITRQRNVARLIKRPETVFDIVTSQQSTFMWGDVEKVLARYVREEDIFDSLNEKLQASRELVLLREEERITAEGIRENTSIYTTQSMLRQELSLVRLAEKLGEQQSHGTREEDVETAINHANTEFAAQGSRLSPDQIDALRHITKADQLSCIVGYAGAGKSTTFKTAKEVWEASGYKVYGLAPTGRAAQNLEEIGLSSQTLHKFLKDYHDGRSRYHRNSVLVLDEAGMVDVGRFNDLLQAVNHLGVKLVISGDGAQSQPIEAGPGFRLVTDRLDVKKIETIVRQQVDWQKEATRLFGTYHTREALEMYLEKGHVQFVDEKVLDLKALMAQDRQGDVVELYSLSRRICGNVWQGISQDLKAQKVPQVEFLKTAVTHEDFALFKHWQDIRNQTATHIKNHMETYRDVLTAKGLDPIAFAALFVNKDLPPDERQQEIRKQVTEWKLETPHPLTPLHQCDLRKETRQEMVQEWGASLKAHPEHSHLMVTYTNRDTHLLNEEARHLMRKAGVIAVEEHFHTVKRESTDDFGKSVVHEDRKAFSKGERLVFTRNDKGLKVKNGTLGTIENIDSQKLHVRIDGEDRMVSFASNLYPYFDRGWAVTIIKSQGSTADRVFKLATFEEDRNLAYVGMTRHRESLQVFGSKLDFWKEETFLDRLSQNREKLSSLDYLSQEEAQSRLKPPVRLREALSSLGSRLETFGYYSRHAWESVCERFLGKTRPEERIMFARSSLEESVRAREMGIHAAPISEQRNQLLAGVLITPEPREASSSSELHFESSSEVIRQEEASQREREEEAYNKTMRDQPNDLRKQEDHLSQLFGENRQSAEIPSQAQSSFQAEREGHVASSDKVPALLLPEDISAFVNEHSKGNASQKALSSSDIRNEEKASFADSKTKPDPYYSLEEVRHSLTSYGIETICYSLLGEPHKEVSNRRHLRYGASGSLAVSMSGSSLGLWKDHSRDEGGDIFKLVQRERGGDFREALAWVAEALRVTPERTGSYASSDKERDDTWRLQKVEKLLTASRPVEGTLGERYLREHRGIQGMLSSDVRFVPSAWHSRAKQNYPALAALARDKDGTVKAIQLIFLDTVTGNKAHIEVRKQSYGMLKGAYVQLQKGEGAVFMAEGVETALSVKEAGVKGSIYAALGISNFKNASLFLEDKNRPLILCADQDGEGSPAYKTVEKAAEFLKEKGFGVSVIRPDVAQGTGDFNDVLRHAGIEGVRKYFKEHLDPLQTMSERDQRIFSYLGKAIGEDPYTRQEAKEDYLRRALKCPDDMLRFWQSLTGDRSFMPDGDPRTAEELAVIERYREKMAAERDQIREQRVQREQVQKMPLPEAFSPSLEQVPPACADPPLVSTDVQRQEFLQKIDAVLPDEAFKKADASLPSSLQEGVQKGQEGLSVQEESLKLETDVQRFIQLFDRAVHISALRSGESTALYPVMDEIISSWKDDERFTEKVDASGNRRAAQYVEQYHIEEKRMQERSRGNAFEM